jgi:hypothetical protein
MARGGVRRAAGDAVTARVTTGAVLFVAVIAAVVSYVHIRHLAAVHGQDPLTAALLPLSIDGTVVAASMVMLRAARAGLGTPGLARFMLGLAVVATLAANIAYGLPYGLPGALISGWPAVAFIGCAEMAIGAVRKMGGAPDVVSAPAPSDAETSAEDALRRTWMAGNKLSQNQLMTQFRLTRSEETRIRQRVKAELNGGAPPE